MRRRLYRVIEVWLSSRMELRVELICFIEAAVKVGGKQVIARSDYVCKEIDMYNTI